MGDIVSGLLRRSLENALCMEQWKVCKPKPASIAAQGVLLDVSSSLCSGAALGGRQLSRAWRCAAPGWCQMAA